MSEGLSVSWSDPQANSDPAWLEDAAKAILEEWNRVAVTQAGMMASSWEWLPLHAQEMARNMARAVLRVESAHLS